MLLYSEQAEINLTWEGAGAGGGGGDGSEIHSFRENIQDKHSRRVRQPWPRCDRK